MLLGGFEIQPAQDYDGNPFRVRFPSHFQLFIPHPEITVWGKQEIPFPFGKFFFYRQTWDSRF
ncbi:MAG: hypothetical protein KIT74_09635 [Fimbriimonadales bacterium]|nr:hypothetical protein [Fimbriimonadales bacterium]